MAYRKYRKRPSEKIAKETAAKMKKLTPSKCILLGVLGCVLFSLIAPAILHSLIPTSPLAAKIATKAISRLARTSQYFGLFVLFMGLGFAAFKQFWHKPASNNSFQG